MQDCWGSSAEDVPEEEALLGGNGARSKKPAPDPGMGLFASVALLFFSTSGGPAGSEQIASSVGPIVGIAAMLFFAILYAVPQALMTAELSMAFPTNGGYTLWVQSAFGTFWAVQVSYWSYVSGVVDTALYPVAMYASLASMLSGKGLGMTAQPTCNATAHVEGHAELWVCIGTPGSGCASEYLTKLLLLAIFTLPNLASTSLVGRCLAVLMVLVMLPYVPMLVLGAFKARPELLLLPLPKDQPPNYRLLLETLYWSLTGLESLSTVMGEVSSSSRRRVPLMLTISVAVTIVAYVGPLLVGAAVDPEWHCWKEGVIPHLAQMVGGPWLGAWVLSTTALANWGLFSAELLEDSFQLQGIAAVGLAPHLFSYRLPGSGAPITAIIVQVILVAILISFDFSAILSVDNAFTAMASALQFAALVQLRLSHPDLRRPYRIPLNTAALTACTALPIMFSVFMIYISTTESWSTFIVVSIATLIGVAIGVQAKFGIIASLPIAAAADEVERKVAAGANQANQVDSVQSSMDAKREA